MRGLNYLEIPPGYNNTMMMVTRFTDSNLVIILLQKPCFYKISFFLAVSILEFGEWSGIFFMG